MNCGCHGTINAPTVVEFCALHAAAERMRQLLEERPARFVSPGAMTAWTAEVDALLFELAGAP